MKSPCFECDYHLQGGDKTADRCRLCGLKYRYLISMGVMTHGMPDALTDAVESGRNYLSRKGDFVMQSTGNKVVDQIIESQPATVVKQIPAAPQEQTKKCNRCGEIKPLKKFPPHKQCKNGRAGTCAACKNELNRELRLKKTGRKPQIRTVEDLPPGTKKCTLCAAVLPSDTNHFYKSPTGRDRLDGACKKCRNDRSKQRKAQARNATAGQKPTETETTLEKQPAVEQKIICIDFQNHPEIYSKLQSTAAEQFRTVDLQAMFIIKQAVCQDSSFTR